MAKLVALSGHTLDLPRHRVSLGESQGCDVPLSVGLGLAPLHFEIEPQADGSHIVRDLSGGAGLTVNNIPVKEAALRHGSIIGAGTLRLGFWDHMERKAELATETRPVLLTGLDSRSRGMENTQPMVITVAPLASSGQRAPSEIHAATAPAPPCLDTLPLPVPLPPGPPVARLSPPSSTTPATAAVPPGPKDTFQVTLPVRTSPGRRNGSRRVLLYAGLTLLAGTGVIVFYREPLKASLTPLWARFTSWVNADKSSEAPVQQPPAGVITPPPGQAPPVAPPPITTGITFNTEHNGIVKRLLTDRTVSLFQADLRQLVPYYQTLAAARNLPSQREMTEAFQRFYGLRLDGFDTLTGLRAGGKDEFVLILTAPSRIDLHQLLESLPSQETDGGQAAPAPVQIGVLPVKLMGKQYAAAQYDPFTIVLGNSAWVSAAVNPGPETTRQDSLSLFPETAVKNPGALILAERLPRPPAPAPPQVFQTAVSNLFLTGKGESRLILTRNPEVPEETFVEHGSATLKEQSAALTQSAKQPGVGTAPLNEIISSAEASITIPDGEVLLKDAIDSLARGFMSQSPSVELILTAQKAVLNFNLARLRQAPETRSVSGVTEALELLQGGLSVPGTDPRSSVPIQIDRLQPEEAAEVGNLLALDLRGGLIFRPDPEKLTGPMAGLAIKARDYRNAELLISLWVAAKFPADERLDVTAATRRVLEWANSAGAMQRLKVGLPALTEEEIKGTGAFLRFENGQLKWKEGEEGYRVWLRKMNPDPRADALKIAAVFAEASKGGAIPNGKAASLTDAIQLMRDGVSTPRGGSRPGTLYKAGDYTPAELRAAARYLRLENGVLRVTDP